jgi:acyl carrier protein
MEFMQLLPDELDMKRTFQAYGVDSVSGIYFIQKLNETFSNILAPMDLYRYVTLEQLADYITTQYQGKKASHQDLSIENEEEKTLKEIARLSDEEVERLLALELQELENN